MQPSTPQDLLDSLFCAQRQRPALYQTIDISQLAPHLRALLVIDGTVIRFLAAYHYQAIHARCLMQTSEHLPHSHQWLLTPKQTPVMQREVLLEGKDSPYTVFAHAQSTIALDRLTPQQQHMLQHKTTSIGQILQKGPPSFRELLWYGFLALESAQELRVPPQLLSKAPHGLVSRSYRVAAEEHWLMHITEHFPLQ